MSIGTLLEFHQSFKAEVNEVQMHTIPNSKRRNINVGLTKNEAVRFSN